MSKNVLEPTKEQVKAVKNMVVKDLSDEEIKEIISIRKVEKGEKALKNFSELMKFGAPVARPGRIAFENISKNYIKYIKESDFYDDLNDGLLDEVFFDEELESEMVEDMREEGEEEEIAFYKEVKKDIINMKEQGLKIDRNLVWDIYTIISGERQKYYLEREGNDIEFLKKLYSNIPTKKEKRIQKRWKKMFE